MVWGQEDELKEACALRVGGLSVLSVGAGMNSGVGTELWVEGG